MAIFKKQKKKAYYIGYDFKFSEIKNKYLNNKLIKKMDKLPEKKRVLKKVKIIENIDDYILMDLLSDLTISNKIIDEYNDLIKQSKTQENLTYLIQPNEFIVYKNKPIIRYETDEDEFYI